MADKFVTISIGKETETENRKHLALQEMSLHHQLRNEFERVEQKEEIREM